MRKLGNEDALKALSGMIDGLMMDEWKGNDG